MTGCKLCFLVLEATALPTMLIHYTVKMIPFFQTNIWHFHNSINWLWMERSNSILVIKSKFLLFEKLFSFSTKFPKLALEMICKKIFFWKEKRHFGDWVTKYIFSHQTGHDQCDQIGLFVPKVLERKSLNKNSLNIGQLFGVILKSIIL